MATKIRVNIGSGNGLLPDGIKSSPEPICWSIMSEVVWYSPEDRFTVNTLDIYAWYEFLKLLISDYKYISQGPMC